MLKKIIISITLFVVVGEVMIRIDEKFKFFEDSRIVKIPTGVTITPEFEMLNEKNIDFSANNLRIMVIGDSYIAGGGIETKYRFSQQLKQILNINKNGFDEVFVLDVSKVNSNTLDNNQTYFEFADSYKPHIVVLGYNLNDLTGNLDRSDSSKTTDNNMAVITNTDLNKSLIRKLYDVYKKSKLLDFTLHNLHRELNAHGIIFPNSLYDYTLRSYYEKYENWIKSQELLKEIIDHAEKHNVKLIVLKFPEINQLEHNNIFAKADLEIENFFLKYPSVIYINGSDIFKGENSKDYILSKYDGHPNEKAHKKMAVAVSALLMTPSNINR